MSSLDTMISRIRQPALMPQEESGFCPVRASSRVNDDDGENTQKGRDNIYFFMYYYLMQFAWGR
jgi:hypothetical protein